MVLTAADLVYDPATHTTTAPDGRQVPHVTAILSAVGVATDFDELAGLSRRMAIAIELAAARGTALHADAHAYDDDDLDLAQVDPAVRPYLDAYIACRSDKGLQPLAHARERRLFHPVLWYTGILDGVALVENRRILFDIKTGDPEDSGCAWQTAAYELAWRYAHPDHPIDARWAIQLQPGRRVPYRIVDYSDGWQHAAEFQCFLTTYNRQAIRRR